MSLSTMNWKRGLLRLWAVAAVLWVGVAFYSGDTWQRVRDAYAWVPPDSDAYIASLASIESLFVALRAADAAGDTAAVKKLAALIDETSPSLAVDLFQKPSIWPPIFDFAKLAFIPPLLLLALGYVGLWVGRGFRR